MSDFLLFPTPNPTYTHASLTPAQHTYVLELLDKGQSWPAISSITGISVGSISNICSKHHSTIPKSVGGYPWKLSPADTQYAYLALGVLSTLDQNKIPMMYASKFLILTSLDQNEIHNQRIIIIDAIIGR